MQVSGAGGGGAHVSVAAQQGMYASFQHQGTPPQHHPGKIYIPEEIEETPIEVCPRRPRSTILAMRNTAEEKTGKPIPV
jgi:hypothetical protein